MKTVSITIVHSILSIILGEKQREEEGEGTYACQCCAHVRYFIFDMFSFCIVCYDGRNLRVIFLEVKMVTSGLRTNASQSCINSIESPHKLFHASLPYSIFLLGCLICTPRNKILGNYILITMFFSAFRVFQWLKCRIDPRFHFEILCETNSSTSYNIISVQSPGTKQATPS